MSWDFAVVVEARLYSVDEIRALAAGVAKFCEASLLAPDDDDAYDDDDDDDGDSVDLSFAFRRGGGTIEVTRLARGYRLYLDSQRDGNRDAWDAIGGLATELAAKLGTVITDEAIAAQMVDEDDEDGENDEDDEIDAPPRAVEPGDLAALQAEDGRGKRIATLTLDAQVLMRAIDAGLPDHPVLTAEGRYNANVARLVATLRTPSGKRYRRHTWLCDGYGAIISVDTDEL